MPAQKQCSPPDDALAGHFLTLAEWHSIFLCFSTGVCRSYSWLTVQSVVDAVDEVGRAGWQADQVSLVLLGNVLQLVIHSRNVVNVGHLTVGAVRADQAGNGGEHARKLAVGLDVGVVDVNLVSATQVPGSLLEPYYKGSLLILVRVLL